MADYPAAITALTRQVNKADPTISEYVTDADDVNSAQEEIEAIETELGVLPKGSYASVVARLNAIEAKVVPTGLISMWHGLLANIPAGWYLCNGENGTPNLADKFILSQYGVEEPGGTGGSNSISLAVTNLPAHDHPGSTSGSTGAHAHTAGSAGDHGHSTDAAGSHTHSGNTNTEGGHAHTVGGQQKDKQGGGNTYRELWPIGGNDSVTSGSVSGHTHTLGGMNAAGSHGHTVYNAGAHTHTTDSQGTHSHTITVASQGNATAFDNRPAYYKLAFIMKG